MKKDGYKHKRTTMQKGAARLAESVVTLHENTFESLVENNPEKMSHNHEHHQKVITYHRKLEESVTSILPLIMTEGYPLDEAVAYLKVAHSLRMAGDAGRKFVKRLEPHLGNEFHESETFEDLVALYLCAIKALRHAVRAIGCDDPQKLAEIEQHTRDEEAKSDRVFANIYKDIVIESYNEDRFLRDYIEIFNAIRKLERVADHALDVAKILRQTLN